MSKIELTQRDQVALKEIVDAYDRASRYYVEHLKKSVEDFPEIFHRHGLDDWYVELHLANILFSIVVPDHEDRVNELPLYAAILIELSQGAQALFIELAANARPVQGRAEPII